MDFTPDGKNPSKNLVGIGVVILLHVVLVYALLTGLARKVVDVIQQPVETNIIQEVKPPPPPPPPPPSKPVLRPPKSVAPPPPFVPPPEVKVQQPQENVIAAVTNAKPPTNELPVTPPVAPAPPVRTNAKVAGNCAKPEYPEKSLRNDEEGSVNVRLTIGADGNVVDAALEKSSGFSALDNATLKMWRLCHFTPAMSDGQPVQSTARMQYVWKLQ